MKCDIKTYATTHSYDIICCGKKDIKITKSRNG